MWEIRLTWINLKKLTLPFNVSRIKIYLYSAATYVKLRFTEYNSKSLCSHKEM